MQFYEWLVIPEEAEGSSSYTLVGDIYSSAGEKIVLTRKEYANGVADYRADWYAELRQKGEYWDCLVQYLNQKIIRQEVADLIVWTNGCNEEMQILPLSLLEPSTRNMVSGYCVLHIVKAIDCLDYERTPFRIAPYSNERVELLSNRFMLLKSKIADRQIFRIAKYPMKVIVREDFVEVITNGKWSGFTFAPVEITE